MIHSFLLIGQSNMAGRGDPGEVEPICNENIQVLRNGRWHKMFVPVNPDRKTSGTCLAESFADEYNKKFNVEVGLIPCADGGTNIDQWQPGELLFDNAVNNARLAQRTSNIVGILWHQGEGDCSEARASLYEVKFLNMLKELKKQLNIEDVPVIIGELGYFLADYESSPEIGKFYGKINEIFHKTANENELIGIATAENLGTKGDNLHFNSKALRTFGIRYFNEFLKLYDKDKIFEEKENEGKIMSEMELL